MQGRPSPGNNHSSACRARIAAKMKEGPKEAKTVVDVETRRNTFLDDEIPRVEEFKKGRGLVVETEKKQGEKKTHEKKHNEEEEEGEGEGEE